MSDTAPYPRGGGKPGVPGGVPREQRDQRDTQRQDVRTRPTPMPGRGVPARGRSSGYAALVVVGLLVVGGRVLHDSRAALRAGDAAVARGQKVVATREYMHAVRMYLPGSPFVSGALARLEHVAREAASVGDLATERQAWEGMRAGLLGARSLYTPHAARLEAANRRLAEIYSQIEEEGVAPGASREERRRWHAERLAQRPGPATGATVTALLGLGVWLLAMIVFLRRGVDRTLKLDPRWALLSAVGFFVGFALFLLGLRLA